MDGMLVFQFPTLEGEDIAEALFFEMMGVNIEARRQIRDNPEANQRVNEVFSRIRATMESLRNR